jgi:hypothetical protein
MHAIARAVNRLRAAPRSPTEPPSLPSASWITYGIGALLGAVAEKRWHAYSVIFPLAIVALIGADSFRSPREED